MNLFEGIPTHLPKEISETLISASGLRIERIVSKGHKSPDSWWYDQEEHEWVLLLSGAASILFEDGTEHKLEKGDCLNIPAHTKHKVTWTDPLEVSVWLAIFYS